jgi:hypothetical protein
MYNKELSVNYSQQGKKYSQQGKKYSQQGKPYVNFYPVP